MRTAVIEDWDQFNAFLVAQPLCIWAAQKNHEIATETHADRRRSSVASPPPKNDNADLIAALSSMA